jgi:rhamnulokinase
MTTSAKTFAAVDLGASSGRVIVGSVGANTLALREIHRFANEPLELSSGLHWNIRRLLDEVVEGLRLASRGESLSGFGIDSWAIDYGLIDGSGDFLVEPFHYRDARTANATLSLSKSELFAINGLQHLPFTTVYQLAVEDPAWLASAEHLLLIPDLLTYWLTGVASTEITNASTTGLLDIASQQWSTRVIDALGLRANLLGELRTPGDIVGPLQRRFAELSGLGSSVSMITVGSHDTASAVVGVPAESTNYAYICCGTWGLVGVELEAPMLAEAVRQANFTNELGVDGRVRFLRNVMGLWLLQESMRTWARRGSPVELAGLLAQAAALPGGGPVFDVDDPGLLAPGDVPRRIVDACTRAGVREPQTPGEITRCILDSLAMAFARTVRDAAVLSGKRVDVVHLVGGGAQNALLCQLTADACGLPVVAGPIEATAIGNLLVQARAAGVISGTVETLRALVRSTTDLRTYLPRSG